MEDYILLKWGTVKGWCFEKDCNQKAFSLLQEYMEEMPLGCATHRPDDEKRKILCNVVDVFTGDIQNDWTGEIMSKEQAKEYIINYGKGEIKCPAQQTTKKY
jgi:hypothetical protein